VIAITTPIERGKRPSGDSRKIQTPGEQAADACGHGVHEERLVETLVECDSSSIRRIERPRPTELMTESRITDKTDMQPGIRI
jgi:hypothetical protein